MTSVLPTARIDEAASVGHEVRCWLCEGTTVTPIRDGVRAAELKPQYFAITDAAYGTTLPIVQCNGCGYLFCPEAGEVTEFYVALEDEEYERTRAERSLQAKHLLATIRRYQVGGSLLDIGAGSGILVEQAQQMGFAAQGVEPSEWLVKQAAQKSIPVTQGIFPDAIGNTCYDVITLIDVIEHVTAPLSLMKDMAAHLNTNGIAVLVTPDVGSIAARGMGRKWWHYRIAHVSYFSKKTLKQALDKAGLEAIAWRRPAWVFPLDYLLLRLAHYVPLLGKFGLPGFTKKITVPLNLRDSWLVIARKKA